MSILVANKVYRYFWSLFFGERWNERVHGTILWTWSLTFLFNVAYVFLFLSRFCVFDVFLIFFSTFFYICGWSSSCWDVEISGCQTAISRCRDGDDVKKVKPIRVSQQLITAAYCIPACMYHRHSAAGARASSSRRLHRRMWLARCAAVRKRRRPEDSDRKITGTGWDGFCLVCETEFSLCNYWLSTRWTAQLARIHSSDATFVQFAKRFNVSTRYTPHMCNANFDVFPYIIMSTFDWRLLQQSLHFVQCMACVVKCQM